MAGEIKINDVSIATESGGTVTLGNATLGSTVVLGTNASPIASNLVLAAGNGIDFSAASGSAAGSSSAVLDDYETGTWSPSITADGNPGKASITGSFGTIGGNYTKIGNMVFFEAQINFGTKTAVSSYLEITNLPFSADASYRSFAGNNDEMPNVLSRRNDTGGEISNGRVSNTGIVQVTGLTVGQGGEFSFTMYFRTT